MNPFFTKGIFSWNIPAVASGNPERIAATLKSAGFEAVYVKAANGGYVFTPNRTAFPKWGENVRLDFVSTLKAAGLKVIGWGFNEGDLIMKEADVAVSQTLKYNFDGWVFDVEGKFESNPSAVVHAYTLVNSFQRRCPDVPTAFCSWARWWNPRTKAQWHNRAMATAFLEKVDVGMPMMYWEGETAINAQLLLAESLGQWQELTKKPIIPIGRAYTGDGGIANSDAVFMFGKDARERKLPGIAWWSLEAAVAKPAVWLALADTPGFGSSGKNTEPPPVEIPVKTLEERLQVLEVEARKHGWSV